MELELITTKSIGTKSTEEEFEIHDTYVSINYDTKPPSIYIKKYEDILYEDDEGILNIKSDITFEVFEYEPYYIAVDDSGRREDDPRKKIINISLDRFTDKLV